MARIKTEAQREQMRKTQKAWRENPENKERIKASRQKHSANPDNRERNRLRQAERYAQLVAEKTGVEHKTRAQRKLERETVPETPEAREARLERKRIVERRYRDNKKLRNPGIGKRELKTSTKTAGNSKELDYEKQIAQLENDILNNTSLLSPETGEMIRKLDILQHKLDNLKK